MEGREREKEEKREKRREIIMSWYGQCKWEIKNWILIFFVRRRLHTNKSLS